MLVNDPNFRAVPSIEAIPVSSPRSFTLRDLLAVIFRRKRCVGYVFVASTLLSVAYAVLGGTYPAYPATQKINIVPPQRVTASVLGEAASEDRVSRKDLYQDYYLIFQGRPLYDDVVRELGLEQAERKLWEEHGRRLLKNRLFATINRYSMWLLGIEVKYFPKTDDDFRAIAAWRLRSSVRAEIDRHARSILVLSYESVFPPHLTRQIYASMLNHAKNYFAENTQRREILAQTERVREARQRVYDETEAELRGFRERHALLGNDLDQSLLDRYRERSRLIHQRDLLKQQILDLKTEEDFASRLLEVARQRGPSSVSLSPDQALLQELKRELRNAQRDLKLLMTSTPVDRYEQRRLESKRDLIVSEIAEVEGRIGPADNADALNLDLKRAQIEVDRSDTIRTQKQGLLTDVEGELKAAEQAYERLNKEMDQGLALLRAFEAARFQLQEIKSQEDLLHLQGVLEKDLSPFRAIGSVQTSARSKSDSSFRMAIVLAGIAFGLFGGFAIAFVRDFLDHSVKSVEDVESGLGLPVIASIPRNTKVRRMLT